MPATGCTDMRKGFPYLAVQVQEILHRDPLGGYLFCFRGPCGNLLKVIRLGVLRNIADLYSV
ncbi:hypothetical protein XI07_04230 [Bradyrhizobium sp. CCBAU 11445]|uniref:IS66 family insertion sequence element accessory protein TnpB n=1 Tax=Bradyrhizobium sp. CCBAU 11445 TaxID=1630896 RepID=UPI003FA43128|nr:hypothetical protein [Bradyrhizobium sp. CCBAU 11445]